MVGSRKRKSSYTNKNFNVKYLIKLKNSAFKEIDFENRVWFLVLNLLNHCNKEKFVKSISFRLLSLQGVIVSKLTNKQLNKLFIICYTITNMMLQPIHIVRQDERTGNIFILAGRNEEIEFEIDREGEIINEEN